MAGHIHSVIISYNRADLTALTLESYLATVTGSFSLMIVDNGSRPETQQWLAGLDWPVLLLKRNMYPGFATNAGFSQAPPETVLLHRIDNDIRFLPGWREDVDAVLADDGIGQYGLAAAGDEEWTSMAVWPVGGNSVVRRDLWDRGLRYNDDPWTPESSGEDQQLTRDVAALGFKRAFSTRPTIEYLTSTLDGPDYYRETHAARGLSWEG